MAGCFSGKMPGLQRQLPPKPKIWGIMFKYYDGPMSIKRASGVTTIIYEYLWIFLLPLPGAGHFLSSFSWSAFLLIK